MAGVYEQNRKISETLRESKEAKKNEEFWLFDFIYTIRITFVLEYMLNGENSKQQNIAIGLGLFGQRKHNKTKRNNE